MLGLQSRLQLAEMDAYQRAQAMILLEDMANRIAANRNFAANYVTGSSNPLGTGMTCPAVAAGSTEQQRDVSEWCNALQGAGEVMQGSKVGTMIGGRGCVETLPNNEYLVTVAWQGMGPVSAPPDSVACGTGLYKDNTGKCDGDVCRRVLTTIVRIGSLS
jgi:type IV pilus assembly protein PilV